MSLEAIKRRIEKRVTQDIVKRLMGKIDSLIAEQRRTNEKLDRIISLLERESGA